MGQHCDSTVEMEDTMLTAHYCLCYLLKVRLWLLSFNICLASSLLVCVGVLYVLMVAMRRCCLSSIMQLFLSWTQFALYQYTLVLLCNKNRNNVHISNFQKSIEQVTY